MLHDELSRIGSGYRHVIVATGTKWAHIQCVVTGVKQRMKLTKWQADNMGMSFHARACTQLQKDK